MDEGRQHYHFVGIGGIGMGALAGLLLAEGGTRVTGSDVNENALICRLREQGAEIRIGHRAENVGGADFIVFSSAIPAENPERQAAQERHIPQLRRADLLARLMQGHTVITVAGAHGKTSTTSMAAAMLRSAGLEPTVAVGGIINDDIYNAVLGSGKLFVAEADESDGSFLCYHPDYSLVTNIDLEHVDHYHNWDNVQNAFAQFLSQTRPSGCLFVCGDDARLRRLATESGVNGIFYGQGDDNDAVASDIQDHDQGFKVSFDFSFQQKHLGRVSLNVPGEHNVLNASAVLALGLKMGIGWDALLKGLASYQGVQRRFQLLGKQDDIWVLDDYGHHPTEIAATLAAARRVMRKRLFVVFQPHRFSRTKLLMDDFVAVLTGCDNLFITDIYPASEEPLPGVSTQVLVDRIRDKGGSACYLDRDQVVGHLLNCAVPGDMILTLGAGDVYQLGEQFLNEAAARV